MDEAASPAIWDGGRHDQDQNLISCDVVNIKESAFEGQGDEDTDAAGFMAEL